MPFTKRIAFALALALALPLAATADDAPGTFKIPGTDTTLKLYGYVQLDATYDFKSRDPNVEGDDWATFVPGIPLNNSLETQNKPRHLYLTARTSRIGFQTATPTRAGNVGVRMEADFNAPNLEQGQTFTNSVGFRLRHAYGQIGGSYGTFLVGQTWSTFLDLASTADTVDFNGPGSVALVRNPMIKYVSPALGNGFSLALAVENGPGTDGNDYAGNANGIADGATSFQQIPDFHASLTNAGSWGQVNLSGVTMNYSRAATVAGQSPITKQGYGVALSGAFKLAGDTLVAHVEGGEGIGRYMLNAAGNPFIGVGATDIELTKALAYHAGFTHVWNAEFRSNVIFSQTFLDQNTTKLGGNKRIDQAFVNTFWTVTKNAEVGLEYVYGQRRDFGGAEGNQHRANASFHYNFF